MNWLVVSEGWKLEWIADMLEMKGRMVWLGDTLREGR
jgi:hypothetical protein